MKPIERIKAATIDNPDRNDSIMSFNVDEWGSEEEPFIIYHKPFTLADVSHISKMASDDKAKTLAHTVIRKSLNADGTKMFTLKDLNFLLVSVRSHTMVDIVNKLNEAEKDDISQE